MIQERSEPSEKPLRHLDTDKEDNQIVLKHNGLHPRKPHGTKVPTNNNLAEGETTIAAEHPDSIATVKVHITGCRSRKAVAEVVKTFDISPDRTNLLTRFITLVAIKQKVAESLAGGIYPMPSSFNASSKAESNPPLNLRLRDSAAISTATALNESSASKAMSPNALELLVRADDVLVETEE